MWHSQGLEAYATDLGQEKSYEITKMG